MNSTQKRMIIVESPSKIKTITKFLDNQYVVESSVGHIRDLPSKDIGIDVDNDFTTTYVDSDNSKDVIKKLKNNYNHVLSYILPQILIERVKPLHGILLNV